MIREAIEQQTLREVAARYLPASLYDNVPNLTRR
jgi:hypothetical protein